MNESNMMKRRLYDLTKLYPEIMSILLGRKLLIHHLDDLFVREGIGTARL
jgi:hypothetical protein